MKHIESLWNLLTELTELNPFAKVDIKYKEKLNIQQEEEITQFYLMNLNENEKEEFRNILKNFILNHLTEKTTSNLKPMSEIIGFLEMNDSFLVDLNWFQYFPSQNLTMSYALEVYLLMESLS